MANQQLLNVQKNRDLEIVVPINADAFGSGLGSEFLPEGNWKFEIDDAYWDKGKKDNTTNLVLTLLCRDEGYNGTKITHWLGAPVGDENSEDYQKKLAQMGRFFSSVLSGLGKREELIGKAPKLKPSWLKGKLVFGETEIEMYKENKQGRIRFWLPIEDYARKPGPAASGSGEVGASSSDDIGLDDAPQTDSPDSGAGDADALDDVLGLG